MLLPIALFTATLLLTDWLLLQIARRAAPQRHYAFSLLLLVWLSITGALAYSQALSNFQRVPPLLPLGILIAIGSVTAIAFTLHEEIPLSWLIGYQAFRIPVEIFLHLGFLAGFVPVQMTWHGRNWDILTGLSALPIAWLASRNALPLWAAHLWNAVGFALLQTGLHSRLNGTVDELYHTLTDEVLGIGLGPFATANRKLSGIAR